MNIIFYLIALVSGTFVALQTGVNGKLRFTLGGPVVATLVSFFIGTVALAAAYIISVSTGVQTMPSIANLKQTSWWMWIGGLLGAAYVFSTILVGPRIGIANMLSLAIAGQIIMAVLLDHFGVFGSVHMINPVRAIGVVLLIGGVYLVQAF